MPKLKKRKFLGAIKKYSRKRKYGLSSAVNNDPDHNDVSLPVNVVSLPVSLPVNVVLDQGDTCMSPPDHSETCTATGDVNLDHSYTCMPSPVNVSLEHKDTTTSLPINVDVRSDHSYTSTPCNISSSFSNFDHDYVSYRVPEVSAAFNPDEHPQELPKFERLQEDMQFKLCSPYVPVLREDNIEILELYKAGGMTTIKLSISIDRTYKATIHVHRKKLAQDHYLWNDLPEVFDSYTKVQQLLNRLNKFVVCLGNPDEEFQDLVSIGCALTAGKSSEIHAYREGDFCAELGNLTYNSSIRTVNCAMLVEGRRCNSCASYRRCLRARKQRLVEKSEHANKDLIHSSYKHTDMNRKMLISKIQQQQLCMKSLQDTIDKQKRDIDK
ncbi:uncharacterized protein LOC132562694 [Ylistrum balloti]|uniref:uncharacterized protein LOC132562694 n=1 Tax=Ylistrum balloti TaxID=509963 RepID=UPI00290582C3|nr:uncharacterized protein LOC132562694 [Ylistrum balloti]